MRTIWKYQLRLIDVQEVDMPLNAEVLHLDMQGPYPCIWVYLDPDLNGTERRTFVTHGTGHKIPDNHVYIGTYQDGPFVWHVFEA